MKKFTKHCHAHCHLEGVQSDTINNPGNNLLISLVCYIRKLPRYTVHYNVLDLKDCAAMADSGGETCQVCGCEWNTHMHVTYELITVTKSDEDQDAKKRYQVIYLTVVILIRVPHVIIVCHYRV